MNTMTNGDGLGSGWCRWSDERLYRLFDDLETDTQYGTYDERQELQDRVRDEIDKRIYDREDPSSGLIPDSMRW